jgi:hypothetical protein
VSVVERSTPPATGRDLRRDFSDENQRIPTLSGIIINHIAITFHLLAQFLRSAIRVR